MPVTAFIENGTLPDYDVVNESGALIHKVSFKPTRTKIEKKANGTRMTSYTRSEDPKMGMSVEATPIPDVDGELDGICTDHPGNGATLANFASGKTVFGFAAADGKLILFDDADLTVADAEDPSVTMNYTLYPGITPE